MIILKYIKDITSHLTTEKENGKKIGFVPTMGALHPGHLSLIASANDRSDLTICSIFVNPTQFNNPEDFNKYPITLEKDIYLLEESGCDILFLPLVDEMYPDTENHSKIYPLGYLDTILEGQHRPGHFQGVCQIVDRLLTIIQPDWLFLGQKDYQQCMVITKLIDIIHSSTKIIIEPTIRENDGLAMSSRNMRLNEMERKLAPQIYEALNLIKAELQPGSLQSLKIKASQFLQKNGFIVDYVEIARADNLSLQQDWNGNTKLVALIAAYLNEIRLIDNMLLT